jgi:hypothetical protein
MVKRVTSYRRNGNALAREAVRTQDRPFRRAIACVWPPVCKLAVPSHHLPVTMISVVIRGRIR